MGKQESTIRMRYIGKTGFHGLKHLKIYDVSIASMYGRMWLEVGGESISYASLAMLCRNWSDAQKVGTA